MNSMRLVIKRSLQVAGCVACVLLWAVPAHAALLVNCTTSATNLSFGNYNPINNSYVRVNSTITVTCTGLLGFIGTVNYTIALSQGGSASFAPRKLQSGANRLNYNLYTSGTYTTVWGDGTGGSSTVAGSGTIPILLGSFTNTATVYGQIPAAQTTVVPGSYTDSITVTLTY